MPEHSFEEIVSHLTTSGFCYPGSAIYGGLANSWDFGPLGTLMKEHLTRLWRDHFVRELGNVVEIDPAIIMNPRVWQATGHVQTFNDPLIDCRYCHARFRADDLISKQKPELDVDGMTQDQMNEVIGSGQIVCSNCSRNQFTPIRKFQLMFKTFLGVTEDSSSTVYLRPETAQGIFVNFKNVMRTTRSKLPLGICDIGKSFRNEITPGQFIFRTREFEQMEIEFFIKPGEDDQWFAWWKDNCKSFVERLGLTDAHVRYRDHEPAELAFYSKATTDIEYLFPWGWGELMGIACRSDYDLKRHSEFSGEDLSYLDPETHERYIPHVIEPSFGLGRLLLALWCDSYDVEQLEKDTRVVMHLAPRLAPYTFAVLPLSNKLNAQAKSEVFDRFHTGYDCAFDTTGSVGKRYRRQDEIGTPVCFTYDFQSAEDHCVTARDRDTMEQVRIPIDSIPDYLTKMLAR